MSAAFSTTKPAWRSGFGSIGRSRSRLPTRLRASRPEPIAGLLPDQAGQDAGHLGRRVCKLGTAESVGAVLPLRQRGGLRVRRGVGERVDAGAAHRVVRQRVGVHRDEQRGAMRLRLRHPVVQRDEGVARPGQRDPVAAAGLQLALQLERRGERDMLLVGAGDADRAGVLAAMTRVQHHQRQRRLALLGGSAATWPGCAARRMSASAAAGTCR